MTRSSLSLIAIAIVVAVVGSATGASAHNVADAHAEVLTDENFDGLVFPSDKPVSQQRPHLLMFYAPWCGHCKHMLPVFNNASRLLYTTPGFKWATESARFGLIDATANPRLAQQFKVKSYPTFFYTLNGRGFRYGGALTIQDLATNSVFLYQGFSLRSFADDITDIALYRNVANAELPRRPLFIVCRPTRTPARADGVPFDFNTFVDSVLMQGRPRFAQFIEDEATNITKKPSKFKDVLHKQHWLINEACADARAEAVADAAGETPDGRAKRVLGPDGEVLILWSDKTAKPIAYNGQWNGGADESVNPFISIKGSSVFRTHRRLALWVWENSYNGVEKVSPEILAGLTKRGKLGIFVTGSDVNFRTDKKYLPALQGLMQRRVADYRAANPDYDTGLAAKVLTKEGGRIGDDFETPSVLNRIRDTAPVQLAVCDNEIFGDWIMSLGYPRLDTFPKFFVIDTIKDTIWRIEDWLPNNGMPADLLTTIGAEEDSLMAVDGAQIAAISKFLEAIEAPAGAPNALRGAPTTTMGLIARYVTDYVPFSSKVSGMLGDDPILFLTVVGCTLLFVIVIAISVRRGTDDDEAELRELRAAKLARANAASKKAAGAAPASPKTAATAAAAADENKEKKE